MFCFRLLLKHMEDITWLPGDTKFLLECLKLFLTANVRSERVKYFFNTRYFNHWCSYNLYIYFKVSHFQHF